MNTYIRISKLLFLLLITGTGYSAYGQVSAADSILADKVAMVGRAKEQVDAFRSFVKMKKRDTVFVLVTNITFSDPNLSLLKGAMSKGKDNVKALLQEGTVILKVASKKDAGTIYDGLDALLKKMFEPSDIGDTQMILNYKSPLAK